MLTYGFNTSCSLGKQSNNMFYGFSYVKCATSGIFPVSRREKMKSMIFLNQLVATNRDSPTIHYIILHAMIFNTESDITISFYGSAIRVSSFC